MQRWWPLARQEAPDGADTAVGLWSSYGGMTGAYGSADVARAPDGGDWRMCDQRDAHVPHGWLYGQLAVTCPGRWEGRDCGCADRR